MKNSAFSFYRQLSPSSISSSAGSFRIRLGSNPFGVAGAAAAAMLMVMMVMMSMSLSMTMTMTMTSMSMAMALLPFQLLPHVVGVFSIGVVLSLDIMNFVP